MMSNKPLSPLQAMTMEILSKKESIQVNKDQIQLVDPNDIYNWHFHDRPENEMGDIDALAKSMKINGQIEPCIVRPLKNSDGKKYQLIVGERRWRAASKLNLMLSVVIRNITDKEASIIQAAENLDRKDLSDYAKGISYAKLIESDLLQQKDLQERFNISKAQANRLMSFSQLSPDVVNAIEDMTNISARLAAEIRSWCNKGYESEIIKLSHHLKLGKLGPANLEKKMNELSCPAPKKNIDKITINESGSIYQITVNKNGKIEIDTKKANIDLNDLTQKVINLLKGLNKGSD